MTHLLVLLSFALVVISGANDGGVLMSMALRHTVLSADRLILILGVTLVIGPLATTTVAQMLTQGLFASAGEELESTFIVGVAMAIIVVSVLSRMGLPTSLTLALVGGLTGAALGSGTELSWAAVLTVLAVGSAAPVIGGILGFAFARMGRRLPSGRHTNRILTGFHVVAFTLQNIAYAINDGQKMLAVAAIAAASLPGGYNLLDPGSRGIRTVVLIAMAILFILGMLWTLRRVSSRLGIGLATVSPHDAVVAELASTCAVMGSAALGAPVSMSQSVSAGIIGAAASKGIRRVRWDAAVKIGAAWAITLPTSALLALASAAASNAVLGS